MKDMSWQLVLHIVNAAESNDSDDGADDAVSDAGSRKHPNHSSNKPKQKSPGEKEAFPVGQADLASMLVVTDMMRRQEMIKATAESIDLDRCG